MHLWLVMFMGPLSCHNTSKPCRVFKTRRGCSMLPTEINWYPLLPIQVLDRSARKFSSNSASHLDLQAHTVEIGRKHQSVTSWNFSCEYYVFSHQSACDTYAGKMLPEKECYFISPVPYTNSGASSVPSTRSEDSVFQQPPDYISGTSKAANLRWHTSGSFLPTSPHRKSIF